MGPVFIGIITGIVLYLLGDPTTEQGVIVMCGIVCSFIVGIIEGRGL